MRLLIVQGGFGSGGAEKIVAMLAAHRAALGDEVHVAGADCPPGGSFFDYPDSVTLHVQDTKGRGPVQLRRLRHIRALVKTLKPDVVVSFLTKVNVLTLVATFGTGAPVIISERNNPGAQGGSRFWTTLQSRLGARARAVVFQTEAVLADAAPGMRAKGVVIANPCEPLADAPHGDLAQKRLIAVGRLTHQKGFDTLIAAMPAVLREHPDARLSIFGEGPDRGALEAQVTALGVGNAVALPGNTDRPGAWITEGDLLIAPSRYEGFPNVVAEAAISALPVVATDCDYGPREIIRDGVNGRLVPVDDANALAKAVAALLSAPDSLPDLAAEDARLKAQLDPAAILCTWDVQIDGAAVTASARALA